jgi:sec-independent protein translocase protein TatA
MGALRPWHIAVLVIVLLLLFGAKKLPDAARGLGKSLRIFKAETRGLMEDDVKSKAEAQNTRQPLTDERADDLIGDPMPPPAKPPVVESKIVDSREDR